MIWESCSFHIWRLTQGINNNRINFWFRAGWVASCERLARKILSIDSLLDIL